MDNGLSASDVALLNGHNGFGYGDGFGGGSFMWIFGLLILMGMFNGGGMWGNNGFGYAPQYATQDFVQNGFNFNDLQDQNRDILSAITGGTAQAVAATNATFHDTLSALTDKYSELARDIAGVSVQNQQIIANQNDCCCSTKMAIMDAASGINAGIAQNRYEAAMNTASINANTTAQTQKILDALAQNKIESLQNQVNQLQLQQAVAGVVRYPSASTYYAGTNPFCGNGCGCGMTA